MDTVGVEQFLTEIKGYSHTGEGVGDYRGKPVFIPLAARGEVVRFNISEEKKNYARGCLVEVVRPEPWRTGAFCPDYRQCGGCQLQHLTYGEQLYFKRQTIIAALQRIGGLEKIPVQDVLPMDDPWHYRHTVRLHVQRRPEGNDAGQLPDQKPLCLPFDRLLPPARRVSGHPCRFVKTPEQSHDDLQPHQRARCSAHLISLKEVVDSQRQGDGGNTAAADDRWRQPGNNPGSLERIAESAPQPGGHRDARAATQQQDIEKRQSSGKTFTAKLFPASGFTSRPPPSSRTTRNRRKCCCSR